METRQFILNRPDENLVAVITCELDERWTNVFRTHDQVMEVVKKAVIQWIKEHEDGQAVYADAGDDLNVGDLVTYGYETLEPYLAAQGITEFELEIFGDANHPANWTYDTSLSDDEEPSLPSVKDDQSPRTERELIQDAQRQVEKAARCISIEKLDRT